MGTHLGAMLGIAMHMAVAGLGLLGCAEAEQQHHHLVGLRDVLSLLWT